MLQALDFEGQIVTKKYIPDLSSSRPRVSRKTLPPPSPLPTIRLTTYTQAPYLQRLLWLFGAICRKG